MHNDIFVMLYENMYPTIFLGKLKNYNYVFSIKYWNQQRMWESNAPISKSPDKGDNT